MATAVNGGILATASFISIKVDPQTTTSTANKAQSFGDRSAHILFSLWHRENDGRAWTWQDHKSARSIKSKPQSNAARYSGVYWDFQRSNIVPNDIARAPYHENGRRAKQSIGCRALVKRQRLSAFSSICSLRKTAPNPAFFLLYTAS